MFNSLNCQKKKKFKSYKMNMMNHDWVSNYDSSILFRVNRKIELSIVD